jgi:hypothetical protein
LRPKPLCFLPVSDSSSEDSGGRDEKATLLN